MLWSGHHKEHCFKKQLLCLAAAPYYAVHISNNFPGANHDFSIYKATSESLDEVRCHILGDCAYHTSEANRPDTRLLGIKTGSRDHQMIAKRVPVEWFFGRLKKLWKRMASVYVLDHSKFADEFAICVFLTNFSILKAQAPTAEDGIYNESLETRSLNDIAVRAAERRQYMKGYYAKLQSRMDKEK